MKWFPWVLNGLPDDPDYICRAQAPHAEARGRTEQVLLNMGSSVSHIMKDLLGFERSENINQTWMRNAVRTLEPGPPDHGKGFSESQRLPPRIPRAWRRRLLVALPDDRSEHRATQLSDGGGQAAGAEPRGAGAERGVQCWPLPGRYLAVT